jgi:hypothetical protein
MCELTPEVLAAGLQVQWSRGEASMLMVRYPHLEEAEARDALARAAALDAAAYELADRWHASRGTLHVDAAELRTTHPGFPPECYEQALNENLTQAR